MTYREQFDSALANQTPEEASEWLVREILRYEKEFGKMAEEARLIILSNLGYMAGYYDHETAKKIFRLFGAVHPIFGSADYHRTMTIEECLRLGQEWAERSQ